MDEDEEQEDELERDPKRSRSIHAMSFVQRRIGGYDINMVTEEVDFPFRDWVCVEKDHISNFVGNESDNLIDGLPADLVSTGDNLDTTKLEDFHVYEWVPISEADDREVETTRWVRKMYGDFVRSRFVLR